MRDCLPVLLKRLEAKVSVAYCRLVETRGSTPQKAGAVMLVHPDGTQTGTLGGGCVEAEVKRRALAAIDSQLAEVSQFELDHDYGWDDGLICGGRMQVWIAPLRDQQHLDYFQSLEGFLQVGGGGTEVVAFADKSGFPVASSFLFDAKGSWTNTLLAEPPTPEQVKTITQRLRPLDRRPRAYAENGLAFLPAVPRCRLMIVGGGHVGQAVAELAWMLDFEVWIVDDRDEFVSTERFPHAARRIGGPIETSLPDLPIDENCYCLIVTRGHNHDQTALFHLAGRGARYVGLIGSRRKIKLIFDNLSEEGIDPESLANVYAPIGIDIGSQTVNEIAVSVAAELVSHRNRGGEVPGRPPGVLG